ncbi:13402_t:CDS:2, partial [Ambispora gerdemannii]
MVKEIIIPKENIPKTEEVREYQSEKEKTTEKKNREFQFTRDWFRVFEGKSTIWILEELFKNPESKLITIDTFEKYFADSDNEIIFRENIQKSGKEKQVKIIKSGSFDALVKLNYEKGVKEDGIMIFDDYEWDYFEEEYNNPRIAIDSFLRCYKPQIEIIYKHYQVALRKVIRKDTRTTREDKTSIEEFS